MNARKLLGEKRISLGFLDKLKKSSSSQSEPTTHTNMLRSNGFLVLSLVPEEFELLTEVIQNRNLSRQLLNQILGMQKINGNIEGAFDFKIPNYYASTNFDDQATYNHNAEPYLSERQKACGDKPAGIKFKKVNRWYDCLDNFNKKYARTRNAIIASDKERAWLDMKLKELEALTGQKVIANTSQTDLTDTNNEAPTNNPNTIYYILGGVLLAGGIGYVGYKIIKKRNSK